MKIRGVTEEDFINYKRPSMFIISPFCSFKCEKECGQICCQNNGLIDLPLIDISIKVLINHYINNPITHAVVFGGLEPLDSFDDVLEFIQEFRQVSQDEIVIYTGYVPEEVIDKLNKLKEYNNIVLKFGRYIPSRPSRYDEVLGITLASDNQYGEKIS